VDPDSVIITSGAQHALAVLLLAITKPGDLVLADELTYPGLIALAQLRDCRLQGVAMDDGGMIPEALLAACRQRNARVLYCMPTLHNATSAILTAERRRRLAEIAREYDLLVVEDETNRPWVTDAPPPLAEHIPERTFLVASTSKVLAGGLRVAYIAAPPGMREKLEHAIWATVWMPSPLAVEIATMWIESDIARQTSDRKRREIEARQRIARDVLGACSYQTHPVAYSIWLKLPDEWTSAEFAVEATRRGRAIAS
jgi:DNA-binding transcriptional MocR family regulator